MTHDVAFQCILASYMQSYKRKSGSHMGWSKFESSFLPLSCVPDVQATLAHLIEVWSRLKTRFKKHASAWDENTMDRYSRNIGRLADELHVLLTATRLQVKLKS